MKSEPISTSLFDSEGIMEAMRSALRLSASTVIRNLVGDSTLQLPRYVPKTTFADNGKCDEATVYIPPPQPPKDGHQHNWYVPSDTEEWYRTLNAVQQKGVRNYFEVDFASLNLLATCLDNSGHEDDFIVGCQYNARYAEDGMLAVVTDVGAKVVVFADRFKIDFPAQSRQCLC